MLSMSIKNQFASLFHAYGYSEPIESNGYLEDNGKFYINYSDILTRLIQEAGRYCESYASDLFIDWHIIENDLNEGATITESKLYGFRQSGVDHLDFIYSRFSNSCPHHYHEYRSIWKLDIEVTDDDYYGKKIKMSLVRVSEPSSWVLAKFYHDVKEQEVHNEISVSD